ncbi:hypothetical protein KR018_006852 [Drosophila ironensis]|nr:hypothetical protein KR018_006852 [Drosophila ironensis]
MSLLNSNLVVRLVNITNSDATVRNLYYYAPSEEKCHLEKALSTAMESMPKVIWRSETAISLHGFLNDQLLVMACIPPKGSMDLLLSLSRALRLLRQARIIMELMVEFDESLLNEVLRFCLEQYMFNANIIFTDFHETKKVYGFDVYPEFRVLQHSFGDSIQLSTLYPDKMLDLRGARIRTIPDYSEPNTILYQDAEGNRKILGYVWDMIEAYARQCNASLEVVNQYADGRTLNYIEIFDMAKSGIVDVTASIQPMSLGSLDRQHEFAYPSDVTSWCTMIPVERDLNVSELFTRATPVPTGILLMLIWICYEVLRRRWRYHERLRSIGWMILATFVSSNFLARILTFLAAPPSVPPIESLQDLIDSKMHIFALRFEYNIIDFSQRTKYSAAFRLTDKATVLISMRNSLNTSFGYTTTRTKWLLFREQQKRSSRPLFRYSTDLCFNDVIPFSFLTPVNSAHRAPLHHFNLKIWQSGLFDFWVSRGFVSMVKAGKIQIKDLRMRHQAHCLKMTDLQNVLALYIIGNLFGIGLLVSEIIVNRVKVWLHF